MSEEEETLDLTPLPMTYVYELAAKGLQLKIDACLEDVKAIRGIHNVDAYSAANSIIGARLRQFEGQKRAINIAYQNEMEKFKNTHGKWINNV